MRRGLLDLDFRRGLLHHDVGAIRPGAVSAGPGKSTTTFGGSSTPAVRNLSNEARHGAGACANIAVLTSVDEPNNANNSARIDWN